MKKRSVLGWVFSILGLLAVIALVWFIGPLLSVAGREPLASDFVRLLVILVIVVLWLLNILRQQIMASRANDQLAEGIVEPDPDTGGISVEQVRSAEEVVVLRERFDEAMRILKKVRGEGGGNLYELPWYIIIGPPGSGKTTALVNSGLDFPLAERFGKESLQGVGGTRNCDWWFTNDAVLLDTAGRFVTQDSDKAADTAGWEGFLRLLKRHRRRRPINGVIVAISLSDLMLQSEAERDSHVRAIKQRIQELYTFFGIRFPVYVLFTKCDLVAGFMEFYDDLGREERAQVWGVSFPFDDADHLDEVPGEFDALLTRLNERLLARVDQERDISRRALIYGFPQQMASLKEALNGFLQDVFRATRFDKQPLLRGFYFTSGTQEGTPIDRLMGAVARNFGLDAQSIGAFGGQGRSYFITGLLGDVIFGEADIVGTNRRVERQRAWFQKGAYVAALLATVMMVVAWSSSYMRNQTYVTRMQEKIATYNEVSAEDLGAEASVEDILPALDALRALTGVYAEYEREVPWYMKLGMYQGDRLGQGASDAYAREMQRAFLPIIANRLGEQLWTGSDDPDFLYAALKTYLMLGQPEHLDPEYVKLWMSLDWKRGFASDAGKQDRLNEHLAALFAHGVKPVVLDENRIKNARLALSQVPLQELVYARLKRDAAEGEKNPFRVSNAIGKSGLTAFTRRSGKGLDEGVPELFTYRGYFELYQLSSRRLVAQMRKESWVLGLSNDAFGERQLERLDVTLGQLYADDYTRNWKNLLSDLRIVQFRNTNHAVEVLEVLSGRRSPMRSLLQGVQQNTSLSVLPGAAAAAAEKAAAAAGGAAARLKRLLGGQDEGADKPLSPGQMVEREFEDLNEVVKGADGGDPAIDRLIDLLSKLYAYLDAVAAGEKGEGTTVIRRLKSEAVAQPEPVKTWLRQVADYTEVVTGRKRAADEGSELRKKRAELLKAMNAAWTADVQPMCRKGLDNRYPIYHDSDREMTIKDFGIIFGAGGLVDSFFATHLKAFVDTSKRPWRWREAEGISLGLPEGLLVNFEIAARIRESFFADGGTTPSVQFFLKPAFLNKEAIQFQIDIEGQNFSYRHGPARAKRAVWPKLDGPREVRMFFEDKAGKRTAIQREGAWAWFRLLDDMKVDRVTAERLKVHFAAGDHEARYEITASSVINPFFLEGLQEFRCPPGFKTSR